MVVDQRRHALERGTGFAVVLHHAVGLHVDDEHDLLLEVVIGDDLVEQHQLKIKHRIREVADETARERRLTLKPRCAVLAEHLAEHGERLVGLDRLVDRTLERYRAVFAGRTEDGVVAEEGVARPFFAALHAL